LTGNTLFKWTKAQQSSFETLKERMLAPDVIHLPKPDGKFKVEVDALDYAIGGVLSQMQDKKWKTIAFCSRVMSEAELNYDIYNKELLAIIFALKEWRCYLVDAKEQFEVWSDHKNLSFFRQKQFLNQ